MEALWNQINLQRPPFRSWDISVKEFDVQKFVDAIDTIINDFNIFEVLHSEAALLSRLIYRMKSKFRNDKGLKYMEKVNRGLLNYLNMSIQKEYKLLREYIETSNGMITLPPKQSLEYVLVRTQGLAKLMFRIETTAIMAANILKARIHIGHFWNVTLIAYAVMCRIWTISRYIITRSCNWYDVIYKYAISFKTIGIPWLPDNYSLPENLTSWLDLPWIDESIKNFSIKEDWEKSIFNLLEESKEESNILNVEVVESIIKEKKLNKEENKINHVGKIFSTSDDLGEIVCRTNFEKFISKEKSNKKIEKKLKKNIGNSKSNNKSDFLNIKSEKDIVCLLKRDTLPGFDKLQLNLLQRKLKKLLVKLTKNNTSTLNEKSFKKVTKCLETWINL